MAIPGSVVAAGKLIAPGGAPGVTGGPGVPGPPGPNVVSADAGNIATLGSDNLILVPQQTLWYQRLRAYNSLGNPNFEVDQRNVTNAIVPGASSFMCDRWQILKGGTMAVTTQVVSSGSSDVVPGTSFRLSSKQLQIQLTTAQASLAAGDYLFMRQLIEGQALRELYNDVHSVSLLIYSSVANLKFSVYLRDPVTVTTSLVKLCTIPTANTYTLIQLPNLPVFPSGNFTIQPGNPGYELGICLAAGSTYVAPAADTWQSGSFFGAPGMNNWCASPVNSLVYVGFVQHEPGSVCSTFMDKPFAQNLDECLRYYCKSYPYATVGGAPSINGYESFFLPLGTATNTARCSLRFPKPMAKVPTVNMWSYDGTANGLTIYTSAQVAGNFGVTTIPATERGVGGIVLAANTSTTHYALIGHYTADTGW